MEKTFGYEITSGNGIMFSTKKRPLVFLQHGNSSEVARPITRHYKTVICKQQVQNRSESQKLNAMTTTIVHWKSVHLLSGAFSFLWQKGVISVKWKWSQKIRWDSND